MKKITWVFARFAVSLVVRLGITAPFVWILSRAISEHPDNRIPRGDNLLTVLALSSEGFRSDPEILAKSGRCRILTIPSRWQYRMMYLFYDQGLRTRDYMNPAEGSRNIRAKATLQRLYRSVLPRVYEKWQVDCVISYHVRVPADVDLGCASDAIGVPYIIFYREGLAAASRASKKFMAERFATFGFWATHLVVHNESSRQLCIDSGFVQPGKVSALGCLRMDDFLDRVAAQRDPRPTRKRVVLFPFKFKEGGPLEGPFRKVFSEMHVALAKLALKRPDVEFVFKPKPKAFRFWRDNVQEILAEHQIDLSRLSNVTFDPYLDAQDLILQSTVVCGINSTTLLEAAIAGKPVVVPYFKEFRQGPASERVQFSDAFSYMDAVRDAKQFGMMIESRLEKYELPSDVMNGRRRMFKKYVSDPDGGTVERYINLLEKCVADKKQDGPYSRCGSRARSMIVCIAP